jgi:hypothetical protein
MDFNRFDWYRDAQECGDSFAWGKSCRRLTPHNTQAQMLAQGADDASSVLFILGSCEGLQCFDDVAFEHEPRDTSALAFTAGTSSHPLELLTGPLHAWCGMPSLHLRNPLVRLHWGDRHS